MILCAVWISSLCLAFAQETNGLQSLNVSDLPFGLEERHIVDYEPRQSDLWLISRDDPVPMTLNRQIPSGAVPSSQNPIGASAGYGVRLSGRDGSENYRTLSDPQQPGAVQNSQFPVYYQAAQGVETGREGLDFNFNAPDSVLVELPVEVTEGLWVRPQPQSQGQLLNTARAVDVSDPNFRLDALNGQEPIVYIADRPPVSQIPAGVLPPNAQYGPEERNYEQSYQFAPAGQEPSVLNQPDYQDQNVWLLTEDQSIFTPADNFSAFAYHSTAEDRISETADVNGYGVLTREDIELLERLGILSAVVIEPVHPVNVTSNFTTSQNSERESENEPALIDHGGQRYLQNAERENAANLHDVVFIDIPHFTTPEYSTSVPENVELRENTNNSTLEPLKDLAPEAENDTTHFQNDTHLTDRQILEILQLLTLNAGDLGNLSSAQPVGPNTEVPATVNVSTSQLIGVTTEKPSDVFTTASMQTPAAGTTEAAEHYKTNPSVHVERIQPRLLQKLTKSDNEIIERLLRIDPVSDSKAADANTVEVKPKPYLFGFKQNDGNGTLQHRDEKSDALGVVKGTYGYKDPYGVYRNVSYIADRNGFHAVVRTNEPGTVSHNTADAVFMSETPPLAALVKMMAYRRIKDLLNSTRTP